jgi:hypothetical protein
VWGKARLGGARAPVSAGGGSAHTGPPGSPRKPRLTSVRVVLAVGLLAIAGAAAVVLLQREPRLAGTDLVTDAGFALQLGPGQQLCQGGELVPGDTGALKLAASVEGLPGPRLGASITGPGGLLSSGALGPGWHTGALRIPLARVSATVSGATVCLQNLGSSTIALGGSAPDPGFAIELAGTQVSGRVRIEYMRPGRESWLALLPTLAHRFSLAKSDLVRHWAAGAALLLMLFAVALAVGTMAKEEPSP